MSINKLNYKQDMPPSGGYKQIQINRLPTWTPKSSTIIAAIALFIPVSIWHFRYRRAKCMRNLAENDDGRTALQPLIEAEGDRLLLWQMRRNRDEENELMKDVPGWVTGTWFGESIYKTNPNLDEWLEPHYMEIYAHTRKRDANLHQFYKQWNL